MRTPNSVRIVYTSDIEEAMLHEDAVTALEGIVTNYRLAEEDEKPRGFALMIKRVFKHEEDDGIGLVGAGALAYGLKKIRDWGKSLLSSKHWVRFAKKVLTGVSRLGRTLMRVAGRLFVRALIMPLFTIIGSVLASPVGLAAVALTAAGGLGYWLYRKMFDGQSPESGTEPDKQAGLAAYGRNRFVSPKDWEPVESEIVRSSKVESGQQVETQVGGYTPTDAAAKHAKALLDKRSDNVKAAIKEASRIVGISEHVLNAFAAKESSFNPNAKASTSTAAGLFQFLKGTWTEVVTKYGKQYGLSEKSDPYDALASAIAGAAYLKHAIYPSISKVVGVPNATDLYFGHFMGPGGGASFLKKMKADGSRFAYLDFGAAAKANRSVYFKKGDLSDPRTYDEIYALFNASLGSVEQVSMQETKVSVQVAEVSPGAVVDMPKKKAVKAGDSANNPVSQQKKDKPPSDYFRRGNALVAVN